MPLTGLLGLAGHCWAARKRERDSWYRARQNISILTLFRAALLWWNQWLTKDPFDLFTIFLQKYNLGMGWWVQVDFILHYNTPMWYFGPCVTFRPCQCHFLDLPMSLFGPEAVPCQWHPPPRIKKKYRYRIKIKTDNKNQFQWHR